MLSAELKELERIADEAAACLRDGKVSQAGRHLGKLRRSPYASEAQRAEARVILPHFVAKADGLEARRYIRQRLSYLWGSPELLGSSNFLNPKASTRSKLFRIRFTGTTVMLGCFSAFDCRYVCSFEAIAETPTNALKYFFEIVPIDDLRTLRVITIEHLADVISSDLHEGLLSTHPFSIATRKEQCQDSLIDMNECIPDQYDSNTPVPSIGLSALIEEMMSDTQRTSSLNKALYG